MCGRNQNYLHRFCFFLVPSVIEGNSCDFVLIFSLIPHFFMTDWRTKVFRYWTGVEQAKYCDAAFCFSSRFFYKLFGIVFFSSAYSIPLMLVREVLENPRGYLLIFLHRSI
jgi:hypothetical protein